MGLLNNVTLEWESVPGPILIKYTEEYRPATKKPP